MRQSFLKNIKSIVIKVGTSILTKEGRFDRSIIDRLSAEMAVFLKKGVQVYVVSSGAIGAGMTILKLKERPSSMEKLQAAAACGQRYLMECYEKSFAKHGFSTAQVLLTWDDLAKKKRFINARHTLNQIQKWGLVPIINENDTVATDEIRFGDNDRLSSLLAVLVEADMLVILSDTNGLYSDGNSKNRIQVVERMEDSIFSNVKDTKTNFTVGGMGSKLKAVQMSVNSGIPVFLVNGRDKKVLTRIFDGEDIGTFFVPKSRKKKEWITDFVNYIRSHENSMRKRDQK